MVIPNTLVGTSIRHLSSLTPRDPDPHVEVPFDIISIQYINNINRISFKGITQSLKERLLDTNPLIIRTQSYQESWRFLSGSLTEVVFMLQ